MAKPQLEHGFVQIAHELYHALSIADITRYERLLVDVVISGCYGYPKRSSYCLDIVAVAESFGRFDVRILRRALKRLIRRKILADLGGYHYRLNKDWESWMTDPTDKDGRQLGAPAVSLLDDGDRLFVRGMARRFALDEQTIPKKGGTARSPQRDRTVPVVHAPEGPHGPRSASPRGTARSPTETDHAADDHDVNPYGTKDQQPPSRAGAGRRNSDRENGERESPNGDTHSERAGVADFAEEVRGFIRKASCSVTYPNGRATHADLAAKQTKQWLKDGHHEAVIRDLLRKAVELGLAHEPTRLVAYVNKVLESPQDARQRPDKLVDVSAIDPAFAKPVAGHQRPSKADHRASEAKKTRAFWDERLKQ